MGPRTSVRNVKVVTVLLRREFGIRLDPVTEDGFCKRTKRKRRSEFAWECQNEDFEMGWVPEFILLSLALELAKQL